MKKKTPDVSGVKMGEGRHPWHNGGYFRSILTNRQGVDVMKKLLLSEANSGKIVFVVPKLKKQEKHS